MEKLESKVVSEVFKSLVLIDWSNKEDKSISCLLTSIEPLVVGPCLSVICDVLLDLHSMSEPVLGDSLCELNWVVEDIRPGLDGVDIIIHTFTSAEGVWEIPEDSSDVLESRDWVEVLEVIEGRDSLVDEWLTDVHAVLDFIKVVVAGESVDESSGEIWDSLKRWEEDGVAFVFEVHHAHF